MMLTADEVRALLTYVPETGDFVWRVRRTGGKKAGDKAGCVNGNGYLHISIFGRRYPAHRLAWLYVHGEWPAFVVDHVNGNTLDNRIENLRSATNAQNIANSKLSKSNTSGVKGVSWRRGENRWVAKIRVNRSLKHLGYFGCIDEAAEAYRVAAAKYFGEFARP